MTSIETDYLNVGFELLYGGEAKEDRTGVGTYSLFSRTLRHEVGSDHVLPLLTTKKISFDAIAVELCWFLSGSNHTDYLERYGVTFWRPWTKEDGTTIANYGPAWRAYPGPDGPVDQITWVIDEIRRNPMSRRLVVSAWIPGASTPLPPCHMTFVFNVIGNTLNLQLLQRSADWMLGVPYNLASYALLLCLMARFTNLTPGEVAYTFVEPHLYRNHGDGLREQLSRTPRALPKVEIDPRIQSLDDVLQGDPREHFRLIGYDPHPFIKLEPAV